jgi:hypothetical protein
MTVSQLASMTMNPATEGFLTWPVSLQVPGYILTFALTVDPVQLMGATGTVPGTESLMTELGSVAAGDGLLCAYGIVAPEFGGGLITAEFADIDPRPFWAFSYANISSASASTATHTADSFSETVTLTGGQIAVAAIASLGSATAKVNVAAEGGLPLYGCSGGSAGVAMMIQAADSPTTTFNFTTDDPGGAVPCGVITVVLAP